MFLLFRVLVPLLELALGEECCTSYLVGLVLTALVRTLRVEEDEVARFSGGLLLGKPLFLLAFFIHHTLLVGLKLPLPVAVGHHLQTPVLRGGLVNCHTDAHVFLHPVVLGQSVLVAVEAVAPSFLLVHFVLEKDCLGA